MHTIGCPFDIWPLQPGLFENAMKRDNASHGEVDAGFLNRRDIRLKYVVPFCRRRRPYDGWFAKNDRCFRTRTLEPPEDVRIDLAIFFDGGPSTKVIEAMPDVVDSNFYGNQLRLAGYDVRLPAALQV